jgi:capsular polysaccharide transport system permease protein
MPKSPLANFLHRFDWVFVATVLIPTFCASLYFGLFASDVFTSESRFVVRSPDRQTASPLGLLLRGSGFSRAQDDSFSVQEYMLSRDALRELTREVNLGKACFCQFKIDQARQLNFDQGLKPVF